METAPREVYDLVLRLQKHFVLVDKQNCKLKAKFINYKKANKGYIIHNVQLKTENQSLETQLANLEKQLENARSNKHFSPSPPPPSASLPPPASASDDSDGKFKYSHCFCKTKSTKLPDPPMLTDDNAVRFDIDVWESKIVKKLAANAGYYDTEALRMAYVNSCIDSNAYKHLAARSRISARRPFATAEKIFKVLQKAYSNVNW